MVVNKRFSLGSLVVLMCICLGSQALMAQEKQVSEEPETKEEKIKLIHDERCDYFIDDLEEILKKIENN